MGKYEVLTKYIPELKGGNLGTWFIDKESDGTPEHPLQFPFVNYSQLVDHFQDDLFRFCEEHPEYEHIHYGDTLRENGIDWGFNSMESADASKLNEKALIAMLVGACRAERFCDGALLGFFESGAILRWLNRLKEIDDLTLQSGN